MVYLTITTEDILQHAGVKGMKWGIRKKEPKSNNQLKAEEAVSARKNDLKKASEKLRKETNYGMAIAKPETQKAVNAASRELKYAKEDLSSTKILDRLNSKPKSDNQLKTEAKYKEKGFSDDEAAVQAYKNIRVKKALAVTAGTVVTVASIYAGYKISDTYLDKVIKSGTSLQNIAADNDGVRDAFYSSKNALDKIKYSGLYGSQIMSQGKAAYAKEIKTLTDIKRISPKNAEKALQDLVKSDPDFAKGLKAYMTPESIGSKFGKTYVDKTKKSAGLLSNGKVNKDIYEVFNTALVDHSPEMQPLTDKFFNSLSKKGYNAIKDVNDSKYSGYKALNPIISFNTKGKVSMVNVRQLAESEVIKNRNKSYSMMAAGPFIASGAVQVGAFAGTVTGVNVVNRKLANKRAAQYLKDNPNSKLSITEARRMLERAK